MASSLGTAGKQGEDDENMSKMWKRIWKQLYKMSNMQSGFGIDERGEKNHGKCRNRENFYISISDGIGWYTRRFMIIKNNLFLLKHSLSHSHLQTMDLEWSIAWSLCLHSSAQKAEAGGSAV